MSACEELEQGLAGESVYADAYRWDGRSQQEARDTHEHGSQPVLA